MLPHSGAGQDIGEVHDADPAALPGEQTPDVHQARVVTGDEHLGAGTCDVASTPLAYQAPSFGAPYDDFAGLGRGVDAGDERHRGALLT